MSERHVSFDMIVHAVCAVSGRTRHEIFHDDKGPVELQQLRQLCWWLARKVTPLSFPVIAKLSRGRHHTSVIHGYDKIEELRRASPQFRQSTDTILGTLEALERAGIHRLAESADPLATARRIMAAPEREATRVPVADIVAMSRLIVELLGDEDTPTPSPDMETSNAA